MSCFVEYDRIRPGRQSIALCGNFVDARDMSSDPTCAECRRQLSLTAEDVFGAPPPPGSTVKSPYGDPFKDYRPKTR